MLGLVDRHIASLPGALHRKFDADYVLDRAPQFILLGVPEELDARGRPLRALWPPDEQLLKHPRFQNEYRVRHTWDRPYPIPARMILYERKIE
jgi:hypothetical protein